MAPQPWLPCTRSGFVKHSTSGLSIMLLFGCCILDPVCYILNVSPVSSSNTCTRLAGGSRMGAGVRPAAAVTSKSPSCPHAAICGRGGARVRLAGVQELICTTCMYEYPGHVYT